MKSRRRSALATLATAAAACAAAAPAHAAYTGPQVIDGPAAGISGFSAIDIAPDGTGVLAYGKNNGSERVFAATLANGVWSAPVEVSPDPNIGAVAQIRVAAGNGGRAVVIWPEGITAGTVRGAVKPAAAAPFGPTQTVISGFGAGADAYSELAVDMSPSGVAYAAAIDTAVGGGGKELRAARLDGTAWAPAGGELNADPAGFVDSFGNGPDSDIAVDNAGNAVVQWNEDDGTDRNGFVRRLTGTSAGPPILFSAPSLDGSLADPVVQIAQIDLDIAADGTAVAAGRQKFAAGGGRERTIARRLTGSAFGPAIAIDGQGIAPTEPGEHGRVDVAQNGITLVAADRGLSKLVFGGLLGGPSTNLNPANADDYAFPRPVIGSTGSGLVAAGRPTPDDVIARRWNGSAFEAEQVISNPSFGDAEWLPYRVHGGASDLGDGFFAFKQGAGATGRIVASGFDAPPTAPAGTTTEAFRRDTTPTLAWTAASDAFGGVRSYRVIVDGKQIGTTTGLSFTTPKLTSKTHTWSVQAVDRLGQATASPTRRVRVDRKAPGARLKITGKRRVGKKLKFVVVASAGLDGTRLARVVVRFGNGKKKAKTRNIRRKTTFATRYGKAKRFRVKVIVKDRAGNRRTLTRRIRIRE